MVAALVQRKSWLPVILPVVLLGLWWGLTLPNPDGLIPQPGQVAHEFVDFAGFAGNNDSFSGTLWRNLLASAERVYGGFLLSATIALPLGLLIGQLPVFRRMLDSTLQVLRPVPVTAWQPLFLILFGLGSQTALFLVTLGCFYPILLNTVLGVRSVEARLLEAAAMLGVSRSAMFPKSFFQRHCRASSPASGLASALPGW